MCPTFGGETFLPFLLSTGSAATQTLPQQRRLKAYDPEAVGVGAYILCHDTNMADLAQKESIPCRDLKTTIPFPVVVLSYELFEISFCYLPLHPHFNVAVYHV